MCQRISTIKLYRSPNTYDSKLLLGNWFPSLELSVTRARHSWPARYILSSYQRNHTLNTNTTPRDPRKQQIDRVKNFSMTIIGYKQQQRRDASWTVNDHNLKWNSWNLFLLLVPFSFSQRHWLHFLYAVALGGLIYFFFFFLLCSASACLRSMHLFFFVFSRRAPPPFFVRLRLYSTSSGL